MNDMKLEVTLRQAADSEPMPAAPPELLAGALQRRARGERIQVTVHPAGPEPRWQGWAWAMAAAAILALVVWKTAQPTGPGGNSSASGPTLLPGTLLAQGTSRPEFPRLSAAPERLQPGSWVYTAEPPDQLRPWDVTWTYRVTRSTYQGAAAWLLLAGRQVPNSAIAFLDSTWLAREGLAALGHQFDSATTWQPVPSSILAILQATRLSQGWTGSIPVRFRGEDKETRWLNLKVVGLETIEVPAGEFTCWKVGFSPDTRFYFWISTEGWPVRSGMEQYNDLSYGKMNLALLRHEE